MVHDSTGDEISCVDSNHTCLSQTTLWVRLLHNRQYATDCDNEAEDQVDGDKGDVEGAAGRREERVE